MSDTNELPFLTLTTEEARKKIEQGVRVIDVRQPEEWQSGHIAEATLLPLNNDVYGFSEALKQLNLPADEEVIFVCRSGQRSAAASEVAGVLGLTRVYNLTGGMLGWVKHNYPIAY